jgi:hypothetical protein
MRKLTIAAIALLLSGCAFHQTPYVTYAGHHELRDTAVFAAFTTVPPDAESRIVAVDGEKPSCAQVGCPFWVRVLPGTHTFVARYKFDLGLGGRMITIHYVDLVIAVADMKPRHVYATHYTRHGEQFEVSADDLGENPDFGLTLGLSGVNKKYYPVKFH